MSNLSTAANTLHNIIMELLPEVRAQDDAELFPFMGCGLATRIIADETGLLIAHGDYRGHMSDSFRFRVHTATNIVANHTNNSSFILKQPLQRMPHAWLYCPRTGLMVDPTYKQFDRRFQPITIFPKQNSRVAYSEAEVHPFTDYLVTELTD